MQSKPRPKHSFNVVSVLAALQLFVFSFHLRNARLRPQFQSVKEQRLKLKPALPFLCPSVFGSALW
jgi:hypothetical protein